MKISKIERVDEIPLILHWLKVMRVAEIIDSVWESHGNWQGLSYGQLAVLYITYIINSLSHKLSGMEEWVKEHQTVLSRITGWEIVEKDATDDRLGIMMSDFGETTTQILDFQRETGQHLIQAFELPTEIVRYDTTSVNVHHSPEEKQKGLLNFGHSKDNHPDLLQFKQGLGVLDPAGIPIFSETIAGNNADDPLYVPAWREMAKTIGKTHFLLVSDCKGSALETRSQIAQEKGFYLFPLAKTGKVPEELETLVKTLPRTPKEIILPEVTDKQGNPIVIGKGFMVEKEMKCGTHIWTERWFVVRSDSHAQRQNKARYERLKKAKIALNRLAPKPEEELSHFSERALKVLKKYSLSHVIDIQVKEIVNQQKHYLKRGRPTPDTPYEMIETRQLKLSFSINQERIKNEDFLAGWRIYVTNVPADRMTLEQSVQYYRGEWLVEHSFHRFKRGKLPILPLFLRLDERIKGLMILLSIALQVLTLVEFVVQRELAAHSETVSGLVPGNPKMTTARPTTERIIKKFQLLHLVITSTSKHLKVFLVETLTPLQQRLLKLMKVPIEIYESLSFRQPICSSNFHTRI
jgi:transposase